MFLFMHLFSYLLFSGWAFIVDSYGVQCLVQEHRGTHFNIEGHTSTHGQGQSGNRSTHHPYKYVSCIDDSHL